MRAKEIEAGYSLASELRTLCGCILGSVELGDRLVESLIAPGEQVTADAVRNRMREAISQGRFEAVRGMGPKLIERLQNALLLGRLLYLETTTVGTMVDESAIAAGLFSEIAFEPVEKFAVAALDIRHRLLSVRVLFSGTATKTCAHPREIFRWLLQVGAVRCIVAHNHPSGNPSPSAEDVRLTQLLLEAAKTVGIPVLDHLILAQNNYESMRMSHSQLWSQ